MINGISRDTVRRFCQRERIALAVLFGSRANGRSTPRSDLDLAFWMVGEPTAGCEIALTGELMHRLHRDDVDVVVLNHANPLLQWQVASTGKLLHECEPGRFHQFQLYAMKRFDDSKHLLALQERFLDRLIKGVQPAWQTNA